MDESIKDLPKGYRELLKQEKVRNTFKLFYHGEAINQKLRVINPKWEHFGVFYENKNGNGSSPATIYLTHV